MTLYLYLFGPFISANVAKIFKLLLYHLNPAEIYPNYDISDFIYFEIVKYIKGLFLVLITRVPSMRYIDKFHFTSVECLSLVKPVLINKSEILKKK